MPSRSDLSSEASPDETTSLMANGPKNNVDSVETSSINGSVRYGEEPENGTTRKSSTSSFNKNEDLSPWSIACILSTSFAYGCIMTTLFLITLPVECQRIEEQHPTVPKSVRSVAKPMKCFPRIIYIVLLFSKMHIGRLGLLRSHCWSDTAHLATCGDAE